MVESDQHDEAVRITTLMDNLNNLKSKLNNFTVMDELGQPIGEIQDLILDDTHQLNLVIATSDTAENKLPVLLNGRRIKKVSVQTHAVYVDIVKADVNFLPEYTPLDFSDSGRDRFTNRGELDDLAPPSSSVAAPQELLSYSEAAAAAAALMGESAIPEGSVSRLASSISSSAEDTLSLEDNSFASDPLFVEPADDFAALEDNLFTSDSLLPESTDDFDTSVEMSSMESIESFDDDWLSDDQPADSDLAISLELPELPELALSPLEDISLESEFTSEFITTHNSLDDDWSDLVTPTQDHPSLGDAPSSEDSSLPDFSDELEPSFSLEDPDPTSELSFAGWEQASQPIDTLSSGVLDPLTDADKSELEGFPDMRFLANDFSGDIPINEDAGEFGLSSDFGEAGSITDFTLESLSDIDSPLEASLDDFGFPDRAIADLDDLGFPVSTDDVTGQLPDLNLNFGESLVNDAPDLSWNNEAEADDTVGLSFADSSNQLQTTTDKELELELAEELTDLDLSVIESTDLEFETDYSGLDFGTESTDLEFETGAIPAGSPVESFANVSRIAPLSDLDLSLNDDFSDSIEPSVAAMDASVNETPTSFIEVPIDTIASTAPGNLADLELGTSFDVDLSLEDEFGAENFAIAETNDPIEAFILQNDSFDSSPEIITSLADLEFTDDLPTDDLPTDDLTSTFGSVADLSFAEEGKFESLAALESGFEARDFALDSLFDTPADNPENVSDEFNFSTSTMGFVDPAAGMAASAGILAGLAGGAAFNRSPLPAEETPLSDIADISDMSDAPVLEAASLNDPVLSEKPIVSGQFKSPKIANAVIDAIAKTLGHRCKSIRIEIELDDSSLIQSYQEWLDQCSDL